MQEVEAIGSLVPPATGDAVLALRADSATFSGSTPFFRLLPPERVGLEGEYDHSGLAKRVDRALQQSFQPQALERLNVTQRGRVVILTGYLLNTCLLRQMVAVAVSVSGADAVETLGVKLLAE